MTLNTESFCFVFSNIWIKSNKQKNHLNWSCFRESGEETRKRHDLKRKHHPPPTLNIQWGGLIDIMKALFCYYFVAERFSILIHIWPMFSFFHFSILYSLKTPENFWFSGVFSGYKIVALPKYVLRTDNIFLFIWIN